MRVSVVGGGTEKRDETAVAKRVGRLLGERGHTLVCGGRGGVMAAACEGASEVDGRTIGILPGTDVREANPHVEVPIVTGIGEMRNVLVVRNGEAVIAVGGRYGTLSEIGFALKVGRPVVGLGTHDVEGVEAVETPEEAVRYVESRVEE
ncbi:TIGR00725 family protein [Natronorarus salvus]|uniref:TIGR00725 family protein n=1 Tax=Natronorarus salvus TaxID=3117733 RepID=UPI002F26C16D